MQKNGKILERFSNYIYDGHTNELTDKPHYIVPPLWESRNTIVEGLGIFAFTRLCLGLPDKTLKCSRLY